jgi:hypothetical protein
MAVVINEFEVVTEPTAPQPRTAPAATQPPGEPDVERVAAAERARAQRVRAY